MFIDPLKQLMNADAEKLDCATFQFFCPVRKKLELSDPASGMTVHLKQCPSDIVAMRCPSHQKGFFDHTNKGYAQVCDFLLFLPAGNDIEVFFLEMKSNPRPKNIRKAAEQILRTKPLLKYMMAGLEVHFKLDYTKIKYKYVILYGAARKSNHALQPLVQIYINSFFFGKDLKFRLRN